MRAAAEAKFKFNVLDKVESDLKIWQRRYEEACKEIESDIKRQAFFNLKKI
jgi:hypothetical protein